MSPWHGLRRCQCFLLCPYFDITAAGFRSVCTFKLVEVNWTSRPRRGSPNSFSVCTHNIGEEDGAWTPTPFLALPGEPPVPDWRMRAACDGEHFSCIASVPRDSPYSEPWDKDATKLLEAHFAAPQTSPPDSLLAAQAKSGWVSSAVRSRPPQLSCFLQVRWYGGGNDKGPACRACNPP